MELIERTVVVEVAQDFEAWKGVEEPEPPLPLDGDLAIAFEESVELGAAVADGIAVRLGEVRDRIPGHGVLHIDEPGDDRSVRGLRHVDVAFVEVVMDDYRVLAEIEQILAFVY